MYFDEIIPICFYERKYFYFASWRDKKYYKMRKQFEINGTGRDKFYDAYYDSNISVVHERHQFDNENSYLSFILARVTLDLHVSLSNLMISKVDFGFLTFFRKIGADNDISYDALNIDSGDEIIDSTWRFFDLNLYNKLKKILSRLRLEKKIKRGFHKETNQKVIIMEIYNNKTLLGIWLLWKPPQQDD